MKIAYLVLAHDKPAHLERLLKALCDKDCRAFVHLDAKSDRDLFTIPSGTNAVFTNTRIPVFWGEYSMVEAIYVMLDQALACEEMQFDYFVLISGSDFPLKSRAEIKRFFERANNAAFLSAGRMPGKTKPLSRLTQFVPDRDMTVLRKFYDLTPPWLRRCLRRAYARRLDPFVPYAGSTWWAIPTHAASYLSNFATAQPDILDFFRNTICPDEMVFHTVLCNWPELGEIRPNLTYADWSKGGNNPAEISQGHIDRFVSEDPRETGFGMPRPREILFARKFPDDSAHLTRQLPAGKVD